jgi:hypothetical protein
MKGIRFLVDDKGNRTEVLIDLKTHAGLWEDFQDLALARSRENHSNRSRSDCSR